MMPRIRDEDLLEGRFSGRFDPTTPEAIGAVFQIIWSAALLVFWLIVIVVLAAVKAVRWATGRPGRTTTSEEIPRDKTEEKPDVWRYGY